MGVSTEVLALTQRIDAATTEVAKDLKELRDQLSTGSLTTAEAVALLTPLAERLEAIGADPEDPVPEDPVPEPPAPEPPVVVDPPADPPADAPPADVPVE